MTSIDAKIGSSSSVLQDLLKDHNSEIGNWSEIVSSHQDESTKAESSVCIDFEGPFYIFVPDLMLDCGQDQVSIEVYKFFGGHKNLFAVYAFRDQKKTPHSFMLMAKSFERCVHILMMDGKTIDSKEIKLEYVLPSLASPKTFCFTSEQLDKQLLCYRNIHPVEDKPKADIYGGAKPTDNARKLQDADKKWREESAAAAIAAAAAASAAAASAAPNVVVAAAATAHVVCATNNTPAVAVTALSTASVVVATASSASSETAAVSAVPSASTTNATTVFSAVPSASANNKAVSAAPSASGSAVSAASSASANAVPTGQFAGAAAAVASKKSKANNKKKKKGYQRNTFSSKNKFDSLLPDYDGEG